MINDGNSQSFRFLGKEKFRILWITFSNIKSLMNTSLNTVLKVLEENRFPAKFLFTN